MKIIEVDKVMPLISSLDNSMQALKIWIQANQREEAMTPPVVPPIVPPVPPVGELGSKINCIKLDKPYSLVTNGFTHSSRGVAFTIGSGKKVYFEVDPTLLKANASTFRMIVKAMNNSVLGISKAYYDKITQTYTNDVSFASGGTIDTVLNNASHPFSSTKFLYALENGGESWGIELYVQVF